MEFIDPFDVECENCHISGKYSVMDLLNYKSICQHCHQLLAQSPDSMHATLKTQRLEMWALTFLLELVEVFGLETMSDDEFESVSNIHEVVRLVEQHGEFDGDIIEALYGLEHIKHVKDHLSKPLLQYRFTELAELFEMLRPTHPDSKTVISKSNSIITS